jgi:S1-C subfamily serine protease
MPETIEKIKPSMVAVGTYQKTRTPPFAFRGTGFVVGNGTLVATNAHVLPESLSTENRETLMVLPFAESRQGQPREATTAAVDKIHDLALLRISGSALPALELQDAKPIREGQIFCVHRFSSG